MNASAGSINFASKIHPTLSFHCPCCSVLVMSEPAIASSLQRLTSWSHCFSLVLTLILPPCGRPCLLPAGNPSVTSYFLRWSPGVLLASIQHCNPSASHSLLCLLSTSHPRCLSFLPSCLKTFALSLLSSRSLPSCPLVPVTTQISLLQQGLPWSLFSVRFLPPSYWFPITNYCRLSCTIRKYLSVYYDPVYLWCLLREYAQ